MKGTLERESFWGSRGKTRKVGDVDLTVRVFDDHSPEPAAGVAQQYPNRKIAKIDQHGVSGRSVAWISFFSQTLLDLRMLE